MAIESQVALVTGASRGIGQAIAARLAADGFDVASLLGDPRTDASEHLEGSLEHATELTTRHGRRSCARRRGRHRRTRVGPLHDRAGGRRDLRAVAGHPRALRRHAHASSKNGPAAGDRSPTRRLRGSPAASR